MTREPSLQSIPFVCKKFHQKSIQGGVCEILMAKFSSPLTIAQVLFVSLLASRLLLPR